MFHTYQKAHCIRNSTKNSISFLFIRHANLYIQAINIAQLSDKLQLQHVKAIKIA